MTVRPASGGNQQDDRGFSGGVVYTETVVHAAPESLLHDAPYQIAIVTLDGGRRVTGRILGERVGIDDRVEFTEFRDGVPCFRKAG